MNARSISPRFPCKFLVRARCTRETRDARARTWARTIADMDIAGPLQSCVHLADARGGSAMDRTLSALPLPLPRLAASGQRYPRYANIVPFTLSASAVRSVSYFIVGINDSGLLSADHHYRFGLARTPRAFVPSVRESFDRFDADFSLNEVSRYS